MLQQRKPLPKKRAKPRRNEGRVRHGRIRETYDPTPNAVEKRHEKRLKAMPCIGCGKVGETEAHHTLISFPEKRWRRDHRYRIPVCGSGCHRGSEGIHGIGDEAEWAKRKGLRCTGAIARDLWALSQQIEELGQ